MRFRERAYSYDDVLLEPQYTKKTSRYGHDIDTRTQLTRRISIEIPIVAANMDTVTEHAMMVEMNHLGGAAILHRFMEYEKMIEELGKAKNMGCPRRFFSIGLDSMNKDILRRIDKADVATGVCIDVAHGNCKRVIDMIYHIGQEYPHWDKIVGNVATREATKRMCIAGADAVKVGIGPGCFEAGTRVLMANGTYKNIEDVVAGDMVINMNGHAVRVNASFCTGRRDVIGVRNSIWGDITYVTPDHRYFVGDLSSTRPSTVQSKGYVATLQKKSKTTPKQSKLKWMEIGTQSRHVFLMPRQIDFKIPDTFRVELKKRCGGNQLTGYSYRTDVILSPGYELGYLFGTFLGDGNANVATNARGCQIGKVQWYFSKDEEHVANKVLGCIKSSLGKDAKIERCDNLINVVFYYKPLADFLDGFGKGTSKLLPSQYLVKDKGYLKGLYDGLIDSDGTLGTDGDGRDSFKNTSKHLTELFGIVTYLLTGVWPNVSYEEPTSGGLLNCNVNNCAPSRISRVNSTAAKRLTATHQVSKVLEKNTIIVKNVLVYDIEVDCPTHSFIANNAIVHNSLCTTRVVTGCGVPQLSAVLECVNMANLYGIPVIADGGIRNSGDIVKALAAGASSVMVGSLVAGTNETPGEVVFRPDPGSFNLPEGHCGGGVRKYKKYQGMASRDAMVGWRGKANRTPEGEARLIECRGPVEDIITGLVGGLRSGMTYLDAGTVKEMNENAVFIPVTPLGYGENGAHGLK